MVFRFHRLSSFAHDLIAEKDQQTSQNSLIHTIHRTPLPPTTMMIFGRRTAMVALCMSVAIWATMNYGILELRPPSGQKEDGLKHETLRLSDFPDAPVSPYEQRNPGETLPKWATKPFFMRQVCFVHVGKTAGSSVGCLLGFELHCEKEVRHIPKGTLPMSTQHTIHNSVHDCPDEQDYYLFAVRDPLQRMMSWFVYERPSTSRFEENEHCIQKRKELFEECPYSTINDLAELGLGENPDGVVSEICRDRARQAISGEVGYCRHNKYNYGYFANAIPKDGKILAIRTKHLQEDWNSAEAYLTEHLPEGGSPPLVGEEVFPKRNPSTKSYADTHLSIPARKLLCEALCPDIQVYKDLLDRALNLTPEQYADSLDELRRSCPKQARKSTC